MSIIRFRAIAVLAGLAAIAALPGLSAAGETEPLAAPGTTEGAFRCEMKHAASLSEADGETATRLVCEELRRSSRGRGAFEVTLGTLGKLVLVTARDVDSGMSVTVQLDEIEELPIAVRRVAAALVEGRPFEKTARVDNLIASEARQPLTRKGSLKFTAGVADVESPGHGARGSGFGIGLVYTSPRFALPAELRFGLDDADYGEAGLDFVAFSIGGRSYLSTRDTSPFIGGGLGYLWLEARDGTYPGETERPARDYFWAERNGIAPYFEVGVEFLRTHRGRLALVLRADVPLGSLDQPDYPVQTWDPRTGTPVTERMLPGRSKYVVPVSIGVSVAF